MSAAMVYKSENAEHLTFVWQGGYVDIYNDDPEITASGMQGIAFDCINVYDRICHDAISLMEFEDICEEWLRREDEE